MNGSTTIGAVGRARGRRSHRPEAASVANEATTINSHQLQQHPSAMDILGPEFRLNAPCPDDDVVENDPLYSTVVTQPAAVTADASRPGASIPNKGVAESSEPITTTTATTTAMPRSENQPTTDPERGNDLTSRSREKRAATQTWAQRHWKVLTIALQSILLLAAIIAVIILARNRTNSIGTNNGGNLNSPEVSTKPSSVSTLSIIRNRGQLVCGVVEYPGLTMLDSTTKTWSGFEVDLCNAVGASIFGETGHVEFSPTTYGERFTLLQSGKVDLLAAGASYTMERDLYEPTATAGFTFSVPYLYDGVSFAGPPQLVACAEQQKTTGNCSSLQICVLDSTSHVPVIRTLFPGGSVIKLAPTVTDFYNNFKQGYCNVLAGEQFELALTNVVQAGYTGSYNISSKLYSKEPIALVTRDGDAEWSDYVNWVFLALLTAENRTITQQAAQNAIENPGPSVDLSKTMPFYQAIAAVGNYGEMYNRHLESIVPRAPVNQQNQGNTPLIYSFSFGDNTTVGQGPVPNGTLWKIRNRGYLRCGFGATPFFATYNYSTQQWEGIDVDLCRAISAAIFQGVVSVVFLNATETKRWEMLANDEVDLLARDTTWNYERDVKEPSTGTGFTFTQPYFYTGVQFGGIPPYGDCADRLDVSSSICGRLKICVINGTTTIEVARNLFPERFIVGRENDAQVYQCLTNNSGNAICGESYFAARATVRTQGYTGSYQEGTKLYSRENLAVVTRQDDPQWSSFVNWIVMATFYAIERNITRTTYVRMPTTNILGPDFSTMLQNAIRTVGSYSDILNRAAGGDKYPISAINTVNKNGTPLHFPPGGLFGLS